MEIREIHPSAQRKPGIIFVNYPHQRWGFYYEYNPLRGYIRTIDLVYRLLYDPLLPDTSRNALSFPHLDLPY